jgi:hypothetical protein
MRQPIILCGSWDYVFCEALSASDDLANRSRSIENSVRACSSMALAKRGQIVVASRGLGRMDRALMGSASNSVVRHAHGPVLVVRGGEL